MNSMTVSSATPQLIGTLGSSGSSADAASGIGFAGALVQAIGGGQASSGSGSQAGASPFAALGIVSLLSQLGATEEQEDNGPKDLISLLTDLLQKLQSLEQGDPLPKEVQDQLASMLLLLQSLHAQQGMTQQSMSSDPLSDSLPLTVSGQPTDDSSANAVAKALGDTLKQLSSLLANRQGNPEQAQAFLGQLQQFLQSIAGGASDDSSATVQANEIGQAAGKEKPNAANANRATETSPEAIAQTAATAPDNRRPVQTPREPAWRFGLLGTTETAATDGQTAVVESSAPVEQAGDSKAQPAWTFLTNDAKPATDAQTAKAALPAQVPVQQFADQMQKFMVKQFLLTQGNGSSEAKLTLTPEHLGQVDIKIVMHNGQLTAQFMTDNAMARDLLENQMAQLRSSLQSQGLQVDRLEVAQQASASAETSFLGQQQRHAGSGNQGQAGGSGRGKGGSYEDPAIFAAELERTSALKGFGYGSSLNVTA